MIRVFGFTSILLLSLAIGTATAANYTKPVWYDEVKAESKAKGENMKKCTKRDTLFGPSENERCPLTQKPYVCFFGAKECGLPNALTLRPAAKCTCSGTKWSCEQSPCPNAAGKPPAAVLVDTHPELKGTGTLVFPSASALETLANVDAAIRQTIIKAPDLAASYLRLGFHDCAPNFPGGGGCDGCVNMAKELDPTTGLMAPVAFSNNGVDKGVYPLEPIVKEYETSEVSRADIWAYATLVAVDASQNDLNFLNGSFKVGRRNCETRGLCNGNSTDPAFCSLNGMEKEEELIGADIDFHELMTWMDTHFGFTQDEVVALMGAHTIGQVNRNNSGYIGQWTENNTVLGMWYHVRNRVLLCPLPVHQFRCLLTPCFLSLCGR
jgi:hypothetical protein